MYMMDDKKSVIVKADRSMTAADDPCTTKKLLSDSTKLGQYKFDLVSLISTTLSFNVNSILDNWVFLNNNLYVVAYGYSKSFGAGT